MAKSGDTLTGICDKTVEFLKQNGGFYDVEGIVLLGGTNNLRKRDVTPESLLDVLQASVTKIRDNVHSHLCHAKQPMAVSFLTPTPPPQNGHSKVGKFSNILKAHFSKWRWFLS